MPCAAHAATSTTSYPVAAIAISRSRDADASAAARTGALFVITMSASAMRLAIWSGVVDSNTASSWAKDGGRNVTSAGRLPRSSITIRAGLSMDDCSARSLAAFRRLLPQRRNLPVLRNEHQEAVAQSRVGDGVGL